MRVTLSASGTADVATAWERYARPARWSTWSPQITGVSCADARIRPGSRGTVHGLFGLTVAFEVTAVDEPARRWSWRVRAPLGIRLTLAHAVLAAPGGSRTTLELRGPAPVVLAYAPVASVALHRLVRREPAP